MKIQLLKVAAFALLQALTVHANGDTAVGDKVSVDAAAYEAVDGHYNRHDFDDDWRHNGRQTKNYYHNQGGRGGYSSAKRAARHSGSKAYRNCASYYGADHCDDLFDKMETLGYDIVDKEENSMDDFAERSRARQRGDYRRSGGPQSRKNWNRSRSYRNSRSRAVRSRSYRNSRSNRYRDNSWRSRARRQDSRSFTNSNRARRHANSRAFQRCRSTGRSARQCDEMLANADSADIDASYDIVAKEENDMDNMENSMDEFADWWDSRSARERGDYRHSGGPRSRANWKHDRSYRNSRSWSRSSRQDNRSFTNSNRARRHANSRAFQRCRNTGRSAKQCAEDLGFDFDSADLDTADIDARSEDWFGTSSSSSEDYTASQAANAAKDAASQAKDAAQGAASQAKDAAQGAASQAKDAAQGAASQAKTWFDTSSTTSDDKEAAGVVAAAY